MTRGMMSWRFSVWLALLFGVWGCDNKPSSSGPIFFEFKQQPGDKYIYRIDDIVEWKIQDREGQTYVYRQIQQQQSIMKFNRIDTNAVRHIDLAFVVTLDSIANASELPWEKERKSFVGKRYDYQLEMRPNGEIITVKSSDPRSTFFFDRAYRPSQPVFPEGEISRDYSWTQETQISVPNGEPATVMSKYRLADLVPVGEFDCAVIDFDSELEYATLYEESNEDKQETRTHRYDCRTVSTGQLYFAYREGFVVKKVNLLTSFASSGPVAGDSVDLQYRTEMRDQETITLTEIHRRSGEKIVYHID